MTEPTPGAGACRERSTRLAAMLVLLAPVALLVLVGFDLLGLVAWLLPLLGR